MDALVNQMDETLTGMRQASLARELMPAGLPQSSLDESVLADQEDFVQRSVRSMYVSGIFLDQPEHARPHAGLQARVIQTLPDMDSSVQDAHAMLASLSDEDHAQIREVLHRQPDFGMQVAEALDARAAEVGISRKRRMQLRSAAVEISTRMRRQHPATVVEEYLAKTEKVYERHGASELSREVAARAGKQMFWGHLAQSKMAPAAPVRPAAPASIAEPQAAEPGSGAMHAAAWMFGIGIATTLTGALLAGAGAFPGVFAITLGVLLMLAAIIVALVGATIRAASK
jgi:hypothetical protein